ncbi:MAG TPA: amidohydrolase/deacetylase family metallohydrolase [Clostridiaceae bacterium]|nr:amidohydrolase/deacetylase family metallohydrolase [Clostridiaceae bacterium]
MKLPLDVNAYDIDLNCFYSATLAETAGGFKLIKKDDVPSASNIYISPGWIDIHAHIYDGFSYLGVSADRDAGIKKGVHLVADAGTSGAATFKGIVKYILPANQTKIKIWLHINSTGILHNKEGTDINLMKVSDAVETACANKELICGIKVRIARSIVLDKGIEPLKRAKEAAVKANIPLMVHIGEAPPDIDEVLSYIDKGDVISHAFHGKSDYPWNSDGTPIASLQKAIDRGAILDLAHGFSGFSFDIYKKAISHGFLTHTISTDLHTKNIKGPVFDFPSTMTKALSCGLPLNEVIKSVTCIPSKVINEKGWCHAYKHSLNNATIFELSENIERKEFFDSQGMSLIPERIIIPKAVITGGRLIDIEN